MRKRLFAFGFIGGIVLWSLGASLPWTITPDPGPKYQLQPWLYKIQCHYEVCSSKP